MAIELPTIQELQSRIANDLILAINAGQTDTSKYVTDVRNSALGGITNSMAGGFDENNDIINQLIIQLFPQTATGIYLERWASFFGITRNSAVKAVGNVVFTGTVTTAIPNGTLVQKADGTQYATTALGTISAQSINVSSITRSGTIATLTTPSNHNLATGVSVTVSGADQTEYNVTAVITVISETTFTYTVSGSPATPATGTMSVAFTTANVPIEASEFGDEGNASAGSQLSLVSPLVGVDETCYVDYNAIINGIDIESDDALRIRLQERTANFTAPFTAAGLPVFIKDNISGVTRIWVETATPSAGYVTIYFTRDGDVNIIPTSAQALAVKDAIIAVDTGIKPANTPDDYVIVSGPTPVSIDFTFTALSPNTTDMQTAITNTLTDYFKSDSVNVATDITANEYNALLFSVIDADGNSPTFTLSSPSGTVSVTDGELAILGTITYP